MIWPRRKDVVAFISIVLYRRHDCLALSVQRHSPRAYYEFSNSRRDAPHSTCRLSMTASTHGRGGSGNGSVGRQRRGKPTNSRSNHHQRRRRQTRAGNRINPPTPSPGQPGRECHRSCINFGMEVYVVKKEHQRTGKEIRGVVARMLTKSAYHPRGIKVMLKDGSVGRVTRFVHNTMILPEERGINTSNKKISMAEYLRKEHVHVDDNLSRIVMAAADASIQVSHELRKLSLLEDIDEAGGDINVQGEEQKGMDVRANTIFLEALKPFVVAMVSEEEEGIVTGDATEKSSDGARYGIAFDPLDGSSNLDVAAPTGSIFGIFRHDDNASGDPESSTLPFESPARQSLVAAGYTVYSSATELVIAGLGKDVVGFTLDPDDNIYRLSRPSIVCPERGPYYSLNEAREPDWPDGLRRWIHDAKRGRTPSNMKYSARYVCSLTADVHRTLLKGGWAGNPRPHLRLLYEAAPLAFIMEAAGGTGSNGVCDLLDVVPENGLHDRVCCFLGSKLDVEDLVTYGDVQQKEGKRYDA